MAVRQLSDYRPEGTALGQAAADLVAFHGKTACAQAAYCGTLSATSTSAHAYAMIIAIRNALINKGLMAAS